MPHTLDATTVRTWCGLALEALGQAREGIDAINVYPVADGDTGTNLYLTVESAAQAVDAVFAAHAAVADASGPALPDAVRAMAHGALIGARGNSGTILAQLLRGMADVLAVDRPGPAADAERLRQALRRAAESAYQAVAHPTEGTVLTVAAAAADAGERAAGGVAEVARAAYEGARVALDATPGQLDVLRRAGVVDAGGCGLVTVLGSLCAAVSGERPMDPVISGTTRLPADAYLSDALRPIRPGAAAEEQSTAERRTPAGTGDGAGPAQAPGPAGIPAPSRPGRTQPAAIPGRDDAVAAARASRGAGTARRDWSPRAEAAHPGALLSTAVPSAGSSCMPADVGTDGAPGRADDVVRPGPAYEVIYLLDADDEAVAELRGRLDALGDSLVVVGGDGLWNVHVHVDDPGAAVEAGIHAGRPHRIRITHFATASGAGTGFAQDETLADSGAERERTARAVVAVVPGEGLAALCREAGASVVTARPGEPPASGELVQAIRRAHAREVVLLPGDAALRHTAAAAVEQVRAEGVRVALIPTRSSVQGLAALAVHEPGRRFDEDVVAMTSAAGATRCAELAVAEQQSWTSAGVCEAGDVLGLIDGDVAVIGADLGGTAATVLDRMLAAGGELVTLVLGAGIPDHLGDRLQAHVRDNHLAVDTVVYRGGQLSVPLLIGVE
ncbi:DAK2 domain-containing protein [Streptomyces sp. KR80]|uniref:DAK2 domain-containing protein n=1 Tax=Streptomyces sp. KR80 TaxID=3457426 RepID=UPI003FD2BB8E